MHSVVIIPTYNERENILSLLDALERRCGPEVSFLVVDDSSPDGTGNLVHQRAVNDPRVRLFSRPKKEGLGPAYTAAFEHVLTASGDPVPESIVQMDADFSHHPDDVPRLLATLEHADLVVGSRYCPSGSVANWNWRRRFLSRVANEYARLLTRVSVRDLTAGFCAWRADVLRRVAPSTIRADGYGYLLAMKVRAARLGTRIAEVPIIFRERRGGVSKISSHVIGEAALLVLRLAIRRW
ncbi:MAG: family 2 glycosyl transferase [Parcubacteria group bacterium Gr01-1014_38]|nr:MAG: family 2 glycosyl transferase [Parcubacteria group bacterium Gr01-1014_38]